jgi:hypothetical protein
MDRSPHASAMDAESAAFDDPTLGGVGDAAAVDPVFPDTVEHAHFVLYQAMDGGLQLRWHLDALSLAYARDAFGKGSDAPTPVLRLHRLNGEGGFQVIADAPLDDRDLTVDGLADCEADAANGLLQAEIGLSTAAGGWVLVARSNRMQTITPVGASFLREPEPPLRAPLWAQVDTVAASLGQTLLSGARPPALQQAGVAPGTFPLVEPEPGAGTDAMPPIALKRVLSPAHGDGAPGQRDGQSEGKKEGKKEGKSEGQLEGNKGGSRPIGPVPGSGPTHAFRADADRAIGAELLVHGSAVPGTLLDLGGHPYRVGAGGRFSFRVPITDPAFIMGLLSMLSELPVDCRPGNEQG